MNYNLLIVDDDPINLKLLSIIADKHQWSYEKALDGFEVQKLLEKNSYKVVLLDIQLPGIDGFGLLKLIREKYPGLRVLVVTACAMAGDREKILKAGADDYISKPVNIDQLVRKIKKMIKE